MPYSTQKASLETAPIVDSKQPQQAADNMLKRRRQALKIGRLAMRHNLHLADQAMIEAVLAEVSKRLRTQDQKLVSQPSINHTVIKGTLR